MPFRFCRTIIVSIYCFFIIHTDYGAVGESSRKEVEGAELYKQRRWSAVGNGPYRMVVSSSSTLDSDELQPEESVAFLISLQEKKNIKSKPPEDMIKDSEEVTKIDFSEKYDKVTQRALLKRHRKRERYMFEAETTRKRRRNSSAHPTTGLPHTMSYNLYNHFRPIEQDVPQDAILPFLDFGRKLSKVSAVGIGATPSGINSIESSSTPRGDLLTASSTEEDEVEDEEENLFHEDMDVTVTKKAIERNAAPRGPIQQRTQPLFTAFFKRNLNNESVTTERMPQTSPLVASQPENNNKNIAESKTERHLDLQSNESGIKVHTVLSPNYGLKLNKSELSNISDTLTNSSESLEQHGQVNKTAGKLDAPALDVTQEQQSYTTSSIPPNPSPTARILSTAVVTSVSVKESLRFPRIRLNYSSYLDNSYRNNNNAESQRLTKTDTLTSNNTAATTATIPTTPVTISTTTTTTTTPSVIPTELHQQGHSDNKNFRLDYFNNSNRRKLYTTLRPKTTTYKPVTFRSTFRRNASYVPQAVVHIVSTPPSYIEVPKIITYKPLLSLNRTFLPIHQGSVISNASTTALLREIKNTSTTVSTAPPASEVVVEEELFDEAGREQSVVLRRIVSPTSYTTQTLPNSTTTTTEPTTTTTTTILPPSSSTSATLSPSTENSEPPPAQEVRRFLTPLQSQQQTRTHAPTTTTTTTTTTTEPPPPPTTIITTTTSTTTTTESPPPPPEPSISTLPATSAHPSTTLQPNISATPPILTNPALTTTSELPNTSNTSTTTSTTPETFTIIQQKPHLLEEEQDPIIEDDLNIHQTYHNTDIPYLSVDENTQIDVEFKPIETDEINSKNFAEIEGNQEEILLSSSTTTKPMTINDDKSKKPDLSWVYNHKTNNSSSSNIKTNSIAGVGVVYQESPLGLATYILAGLGLVPLLLGIFVLVRQLLLKSKKKVLDESEYSSEYNRSPLPTKLPRVPAHINWEENKTQSTPATTNVVTTVQPTKWEFPREKLRLQTVLGEGNFGQVWKAEADDICDHEGLTRLVAVKTVKEGASPRQKEDLLRELGIMQELGAHPNVVTLLGCCTDKEPYLLIMEYVMYGKLLAFLREHRTRAHYFNFSDLSSALTSRDLTVFAYCVARGMEYLVSKGIIHRDLAARNILVDHNKLCKIADFGMSRNVRDTGQIYEQRPNRGALPIRWMAPESLHFSLFTHRSDVWSFGILLWEIITLGSTPYNTMGAREVMRQVRGGYRLDKPKHCKPEFYKVVTKCWHSDPMKRPTFSELKQDIGNLLGDKDTEGGFVDLEALAEEMCDQSVH